MTILFNTALSLKYYKVQIAGEKPAGSHGKKKTAAIELRSTLELSERFNGRVPLMETLDSWMDTDVKRFRKEKMHVHGQHTGDGDTEEGDAVHGDSDYQIALADYANTGLTLMGTQTLTLTLPLPSP